MFAPIEDLYRLAPELVLCAFGILVMLAEPFVPRKRSGFVAFLALLGAGAALAATRLSWAHPGTAFYGLVRVDDFSIFLHFVVGAVAVLVILGSRDYLEREGLHRGEFYALVLFATAGMGVMVSAQELVTAFIGLEISSISSYILASFRRNVPKSNESAMKYFLLRIFDSFFAASQLWVWAMWVSAALTMFAGNLAALVQSNVKRMLAYSSIAHAGYILVAFAARNELGTAAVLFYLVAYALMKLGAFTMVTHLGGEGERRLEINDYAGLGSQQPVAAAFLTLYLFSLLGLPVTAGFLGKFYIFNAALKSHLVWLAVLLAINTVIGAYYYLRVIVVMYMREPQKEWAAAPIPRAVALVLVLTAAGTLYLGLFPNYVMEFATQSAVLPR